MPYDVWPGEGYDGDVQLASHAPGHHNGQYCLTDGSATLMRMSEMPDQGYGIQGMGDWKAAIAEAVGGNELKILMSAFWKFQDQFIDIVNKRDGIINGYLEAASIYQEAKAVAVPEFISLPFGASIPNPVLVPSMVAFRTVVEGIQFFSRSVITVQNLSIVFAQIENVLRNGGLVQEADGMKNTLNLINKSLLETDMKFVGPSRDQNNPLVPEYFKTKVALGQAFTEELKMWGVQPGAYDDPRWFQAFLKAADKVVPLPEAAKREAGLAGLGDFGALGNPMPAVVIALIAVIATIGAVLAVLKVIDHLVPDQNFKARESVKIAVEAQRRKAAVEQQMRAQGKSQQEIDAAKASIDKDTEGALAKIPDPPSFLSGIVGPLGLVLVAGAAYMALK